MKSLFLTVSAVLLIAFAGCAAAFDIQLSESTISVHTGETKSIDLLITSPLDDIIIFSVPIEQPWMTVPTHLAISENETKAARITFSPFDRTEPSLYKLDLVLEAVRGKEKKNQSISVSVRSAQVAIEKIDIGGELQPNGWGQLDAYVKNYENTTAIALIDIKVGPFLSWADNVTLAPGEFYVLKKGFTIPECQKAGEYPVSADVYFRDVHVFSTTSTFVIPEKFMPVVSKNQSTYGIRAETTITVKNNGNVDGVEEINEQMPGALFFSGDPPSKTDNGFTWVLSMGACQTRTIRYQIDYTIIPVVLFLLLVLWYVFFRLRTVSISKRILQKASIEKGIEFTVGIDMKGWVGVKDVEIRDFVPALFEVRDTPGIKPIKNKTEAGTELIWKFKQFNRYEERILDYKVVPLISITGNVTLPKASVSFTYLTRRITKSSNLAVVGLKLVEHVEKAGKISDWIASTLEKVKK